MVAPADRFPAFESTRQTASIGRESDVRSALLIDLGSWPLALIVAAFAGVAAIIAWFGIKMTKTARDLAHNTGLGEALVGALFIGASTSLSGITTSVSAAAESECGHRD